MNEAQELLAIHLGELGVEFISEYRFHCQRKWALDFYLPEKEIGIEIEGGISKYEKFHPEWTKQRHQRADGMKRDMEKYNTASLMGIKLVRFTTEWVLTGKAKKFLQTWLKK